MLSSLALAGRAALQRDALLIARAFAKKAESAAKPSGADQVALSNTDWKDVKLPEGTAADIPTTIQRISFGGDLRSTSGLGLGDGIKSHTEKWLQGNVKSPMEYINEAEPIKVSGAVVASYGSDDPALGCPVEYISLKGTSYDKPAVCKYTGNRYYSDDWMYSH